MLVNIPLQIALVAPVAAFAAVNVLSAWARTRQDVAIVAVESAAAPGGDGPILGLIGKLEQRLFASRLARRAPAPSEAPPRDTGGPLDLVVMLGGAKAPADMIARARFGAVSLDLGAATTFWDVAARNVSSPFALRRPGSDMAFVHGRMENPPYWILSSDYLARKAVAYLKRFLVRLSETRMLPAEQPMPFALREDRPGPAQALGYGFAAAARMMKAAAMRPLKRQMRWRVRIAEGAWPHADLTKSIEVPNPPGNFLADPFVFDANGRDLLFVEEYDDATKLGFLCVYEIKDGRAERLGDVLREPFHLSYPFVFTYQGRTLMVPETASIGEIRVYEAQDFPLNWKPVATLMKDVRAVDTMLFERDGKWWMLTNIDSAGVNSFADELHLFHADHPLSEHWTAHPMNPIRFDPAMARNGGFVRECEKLYRVAQQQDFHFYGRCVIVYEIVTMTETQYEEREVARVKPDFARGMQGLHHLSTNGRYTVFDIGRYESLK